MTLQLWVWWRCDYLLTKIEERAERERDNTEGCESYGGEKDERKQCKDTIQHRSRNSDRTATVLQSRRIQTPRTSSDSTDNLLKTWVFDINEYGKGTRDTDLRRLRANDNEG